MNCNTAKRVFKRNKTFNVVTMVKKSLFKTDSLSNIKKFTIFTHYKIKQSSVRHSLLSKIGRKNVSINFIEKEVSAKRQVLHLELLHYL